MRWEEEDGSREEGRQKNERGRRGSRREGTGRRVGRMKEFKLPPAPSSHLIPESVRLPSFPFLLRPLSSLLHYHPLSIISPLFSPSVFPCSSFLSYQSYSLSIHYKINNLNKKLSIRTQNLVRRRHTPLQLYRFQIKAGLFKFFSVKDWLASFWPTRSYVIRQINSETD